MCDWGTLTSPRGPRAGASPARGHGCLSSMTRGGGCTQGGGRGGCWAPPPTWGTWPHPTSPAPDRPHPSPAHPPSRTRGGAPRPEPVPSLGHGAWSAPDRRGPSPPSGSRLAPAVSQGRPTPGQAGYTRAGRTCRRHRWSPGKYEPQPSETPPRTRRKDSAQQGWRCLARPRGPTQRSEAARAASVTGSDSGGDVTCAPAVPLQCRRRLSALRTPATAATSPAGPPEQPTNRTRLRGHARARVSETPGRATTARPGRGCRARLHAREFKTEA